MPYHDVAHFMAKIARRRYNCDYPVTE